MKVRIWKVKLAVMICFAMFIAVCDIYPQKVKAIEKVCFTINTSKSELVKGDIVTYTVLMSHNVNGVGLDLEFIYDDSRLELQEITKGNVFEGETISDLNDTTSGKIRVVIASTSVINDGSVFTVTFKVKESVKGIVNTKISKVELINENYEDIEYRIENNTTTVEVQEVVEEQKTSKEDKETNTEEQSIGIEEEKISKEEKLNMEETEPEAKEQIENTGHQDSNNQNEGLNLEEKEDNAVMKKESDRKNVFLVCLILVCVCIIGSFVVFLTKKYKNLKLRT